MNSTKQPLMRSGRLTAKGCDCCGGSRGGRAAEKRSWMREFDVDDTEALAEHNWQLQLLEDFEELWEECHGHWTTQLKNSSLTP